MKIEHVGAQIIDVGVATGSYIWAPNSWYAYVIDLGAHIIGVGTQIIDLSAQMVAWGDQSS